MIKFVNLQTGNLYDGSQPYIHWFDGQQSTGLTYSQPICFITDEDYVRVEMDPNDIFDLVNPQIQSIENVNGFNYKNINELKVEYLDSRAKSTNNYLQGESYEGYKIYIIYIIGSSSVGAEYVGVFKINGIPYNIGADFYQEDETLYINASNFGVNIPESIQRAIYDSNIHDEKKDNILLNRKLKELLSNYWDIIANKGSYKSLINSLKWFEWGDLVRIREIWKHEDFGKTIYDDRALCSVLEDKYKDSLSNFAKTTYISLYSSMQKIIKGEYDSEKNPQLENISSKWSRNDLALKMCLLGNFYETYFMPIHLDLIHSTIEDVVYANTIKLINGYVTDREDFIFNVNDFKCIINNNKPITITNVSISTDKYSLGVKPITEITEVVESEFWNNYYNGPGALVNVKCEVPVEMGDFITKEQVFINGDRKINEHKIITDNISDNQLMIPVEFNVFIKDPGEYKMNISFLTAGSKVYNKIVEFEVIDITSATLNIYRIKKKDEPLIDEDLKSFPNFKKAFNRLPANDKGLETYKNIIPIRDTKESIGLNHIIAINKDYNILQTGNDQFKFISDQKSSYDTTITDNYIEVKRKLNKVIEYEVVLHNIKELDSNCSYILEFDALQKNNNGRNIDIITHICDDDGALDSFMYNGDVSNGSRRTLKNNELQHIELSIKTMNNTFKSQYIYIGVVRGYRGVFNTLNISNVKLKKIPDNYFWVTKSGDDYHYDIGISKTFKTEIPVLLSGTTDNIYKYLIKNDLGFFPEFHYLEPFGGEKIDDYIINDGESLCIIPTINSKDSIIDFNWGKETEERVWIYENVSTGENFEYQDITNPIIAGNNKFLTNGYYNIIFKYKLSDNKQHNLRLNSAFIKK